MAIAEENLHYMSSLKMIAFYERGTILKRRK